MAILLQLIISVTAAVGVGLILSDVFGIPKYSASKAISTLGKRQKKKTNPLDIWLGDLSVWLSGKLKLGEYKRLQLKVDLDSADMTLSPEYSYSTVSGKYRTLEYADGAYRFIQNADAMLIM